MTVPEKQVELKRLKTFFTNAELPKGTIKVDGYMTLSDPKGYVEANFLRAEKGIDNNWNDAAIFRLQQLENYLVSGKKVDIG